VALARCASEEAEKSPERAANREVSIMIIVIEPHNAIEYPKLMEEMFRLRARVFHDRLGWAVQVSDGKERDKYDDEAPVYLIYADDEAREVKGCLRLLPTTGPTVFTDFGSDALPEAVHFGAPSIWECTRFCLDDRILSRGNQEELYFASAVLMAALSDVAFKAGIESILGNFDSTMLRLYRRIGCEVDVLASTHRYGQPTYLGLFPIFEPILRRVERKLKNAQCLMEKSKPGDLPWGWVTGAPPAGGSTFAKGCSCTVR
jgi:acyl homoserine lactone synthase